MLPRLLTRLAGALVLATAGPFSLASQALAPASRLARAASAASYRAHLEFLASDLLEGRGTATRGGLLAAQYVATQFQRLGLEPAGDSGYFHRVPIVGLTPEPSLRTTGGVATALAYRDDYVLWSLRDEADVALAAPALFVGYGIVAPEWGWDDYAGVDARGKLVVVLVNDPGLRDSTIFRGRVLTYYGRWTYKIEEAARQKAAGILLIHSPESATYPWGTVTASWTGEQVRVESSPTPLAVAGWLRDSTAALLFKQAGLDYAGSRPGSGAPSAARPPTMSWAGCRAAGPWPRRPS